jgi:hypothetical protein
MKQRRARSVPWLTAATFLFAMMLLPGPSMAAGKSGKAAKPVAAKPAAAKSAAGKPKAGASSPAKGSSSSSGSASADASSAKSSTASSSQPYEVPAPAPSAAPATPPADTSAKPATPAASETPKPAEAAAETAKPAETPAAAESAASAPAPAAPAVEEPPPPPEEPPPVYVEHLGPASYPGNQRGLYGGSLWLEPSFHGLQWPYMAKSGVGVSGMLWVDSGYQQIKRDSEKLPNTALSLEQGRAVLRVTPTYTNGQLFIQGQVELVGNLCQATSQACTTGGTFDTDDLWIRVGQWNKWDLKVGRFEGWELYHTGMSLDLYTLERQGAQQIGLRWPDDDAHINGLQAPDFYGTNWLHDRPSAGLGVGYLAFHAYPSDNFRLEVLGELGADPTTKTTSTDTTGNTVTTVTQGYTYMGGRPSLILDQGWLKVKVGAEYERRTGDVQDISTGSKQDSKVKRTRWGVGGSVQFVIDPRAEFGANFALGSQSNHTTTGELNEVDSYSRNSVGGFANLRLAGPWLLGAGANFTWQNNKYYFENSQSPDYTAHLQGFLALQYLLARQLYIKAVIGYARADFVTSQENIPMWSDYMYSGRIRLMYLY